MLEKIKHFISEAKPYIARLFVFVLVFSSMFCYVEFMNKEIGKNDAECDNIIRINIKEVKDSNKKVRCDFNITLGINNATVNHLSYGLTNKLAIDNLFSHNKLVISKEYATFDMFYSNIITDENKTIYHSIDETWMSMYGNKELYPYDSYMMNITFDFNKSIQLSNQNTAIDIRSWPGDWGQDYTYDFVNSGSSVVINLQINRASWIASYINWIFGFLILINLCMYITYYDAKLSNYSSAITILFALSSIMLSLIPEFPVKSLINIIFIRVLFLSMAILIPYLSKVFKKNDILEFDVYSALKNNFNMFWVFYSLLFIISNWNNIWIDWSRFLPLDILFSLFLVIQLNIVKKHPIKDNPITD